MKKITLVIMAFIAGFAMNAQSTSFESSEGFTLGAINGQNGWGDFGTIPAIPVVSNSQASDGTYSIHLIATNAQALAGGFSPTFTSSLDVSITVDMYVASDAGGNASDVDFATQSNSQGFLTSRVKFAFDDTVNVLDDPGTGTAFIDTGATVIRDAWFELKILHKFSTSEILYYVDGTLIYTGTVFAGTNVEQMIALFDNYGSDAFFDNVVYSDGTVLGVDEFNANSITHKYNNTTDVLTLESSNIPLDGVEIYSILGQQVMKRSLSKTSEYIDLSTFQDGVYLAKVTSEGRSKTIKLLKQ